VGRGAVRPRVAGSVRVVATDRTSIVCAVAAVAAYGCALATLVLGYSHATDTACPNGAAAPIAFWPLLAGAVILALAAYKLRPRRRNEHGDRSGTDVLAIFVLVAVPLAAAATIFGYALTYACWE